MRNTEKKKRTNVSSVAVFFFYNKRLTDFRSICQKRKVFLEAEIEKNFVPVF